MKTEDLSRLEVAEMFLTMGADPLIGAVVAKVESLTIANTTKNVFHFNPTTFVSRTCTQQTQIADIQFVIGDECYISLLPSEKEASSRAGFSVGRSLAFAAGPHSCIGKSISLSILQIADEIVELCFPEGFQKRSVPASNNSVFLAFDSL